MSTPASEPMFEQALLLTEQMRSAAEQSDWERLATLEDQRTRVLQDSKSHVDVNNPLLSPRAQECISGMLAHDREIRVRVQLHMEEIKREISSNRNTYRVRQAYGV